MVAVGSPPWLCARRASSSSCRLSTVRFSTAVASSVVRCAALRLAAACVTVFDPVTAAAMLAFLRFPEILLRRLLLGRQLLRIFCGFRHQPLQRVVDAVAGVVVPARKTPLLRPRVVYL